MTRIGSLCSGYGGLDIAARAVFGGDLTWWSDIDPAAIKVMTHHHPAAPNLGDLRGVAWWDVSRVDVLTAGYPCQPFSNAGRRLGIDDPRHLWPWVARAIGALRPRIVVLENVAAHLGRGFDLVLADLAVLGYDAAWTVVRASDVGAPHRRARLFVVAADTARERGHRCGDPRPGRRPEPTDSRDTAADTEGLGWPEGWPESARLVGGSDAASRGDEVSRWGIYGTAIRRWEPIIGRSAPSATVTGQRGRPQLSPGFVEWMMGLPTGYVTGVPGLSRNDMLHVLGNGVVASCAAWAVGELVRRLA